jgi:peptidoglycan hydrolase-like protein with peptidoglycan-binding domain
MTWRRSSLTTIAVCAAIVGSAISPASAALLHHKSKKKTSSKVHGQQGIDTERATQIQQALIREHYMTGTPSGQWDDATKAAMTKFQADNGWQTKLTAASTSGASSSGAASHGSSDTLGSAITAHSSSQNVLP